MMSMKRWQNFNMRRKPLWMQQIRLTAQVSFEMISLSMGSKLLVMVLKVTSPDQVIPNTVANRPYAGTEALFKALDLSRPTKVRLALYATLAVLLRVTMAL